METCFTPLWISAVKVISLPYDVSIASNDFVLFTCLQMHKLLNHFLCDSLSQSSVSSLWLFSLIYFQNLCTYNDKLLPLSLSWSLSLSVCVWESVTLYLMFSAVFHLCLSVHSFSLPVFSEKPLSPRSHLKSSLFSENFTLKLMQSIWLHNLL